MTPQNQRLRDALIAVESIAVSALACQPEPAERCELHLKLAVYRARDVLLDAIHGNRKETKGESK